MQNVSEKELMEKEAALRAEVERLLPDFVNSCRDKAEVVIMHQDAFAADYQDHEYALLGKAIKFAGLHGKEVRIIGKNRETLKEGTKPNCCNEGMRSNQRRQILLFQTRQRWLIHPSVTSVVRHLPTDPRSPT